MKKHQQARGIYGIFKRTPENMTEEVKGEKVIGGSDTKTCEFFERGFRWLGQLGLYWLRNRCISGNEIRPPLQKLCDYLMPIRPRATRAVFSHFQWMVLDLYPGCRRYDTKLTVGAGSQSSSPLEGPRSVELTIHYLLKKLLWRFLGIGDPKNRGGRLSRRGQIRQQWYGVL